MPVWGLIQVLVFAGVLIQQSALPTYAQTNFALYREAIVSSNDTCGLQGKDEFCSAVDRIQRCQKLDFCDAKCPFGENRAVSVDLVATGMFHGEVSLSVKCCIDYGRYMRYNQNNSLCNTRIVSILVNTTLECIFVCVSNLPYSKRYTL